MPNATAVALLVAGVVVLWAIVRLIASRTSVGTPKAASGRRLLSGSAVGIILAAISTQVPGSLYWAAAAVAGICVGAATANRLEADRAWGTSGHRIPSLRPAPRGSAGSMSGAGATVAAGTILITVTTAFNLRLLGPSDPGLVALGAYVGVLLACALERDGRSAWARRFADMFAGGVGAGVAAALVILLP